MKLALPLSLPPFRLLCSPFCLPLVSLSPTSVFIFCLTLPLCLTIHFSLCLPPISTSAHLVAFSFSPPLSLFCLFCFSVVFLPSSHCPLLHFLLLPHLFLLLFLSSGAPSIRLSGAASGWLPATIFHRQPAKQLTAQPPPGNCFGCEQNFKHRHTASLGPPKHCFPLSFSLSSLSCQSLYTSLYTSLCLSLSLSVFLSFLSLFVFIYLFFPFLSLMFFSCSFSPAPYVFSHTHFLPPFFLPLSLPLLFHPLISPFLSFFFTTHREQGVALNV